MWWFFYGVQAYVSNCGLWDSYVFFFLAKWDGYWHGIMESLESLGFF